MNNQIKKLCDCKQIYFLRSCLLETITDLSEFFMLTRRFTIKPLEQSSGKVFSIFVPFCFRLSERFLLLDQVMHLCSLGAHLD